MLDVMVSAKLASNVVSFPPLPKDYVEAQNLERGEENFTLKML
jgi:hypothetical protein